MKKAFILFMLVFLGLNLSVSAQKAKAAAESRTKVQIHTDFGDITLVLYNETPKHRDNFIKLVNQGWYNGSPFHRIIKDFMIQGGGSNGKDDPGYTVPAEFVAKYFHKKGALCAARTGDEVNPAKASSGSQFYIVQGRKFDDTQLDAFEKRMSKPFTPEMRQAYKTQGGTPHLDGAYTVFGEVIAGLDVVDKIAAVQVEGGSKPVKEVKMTVKIIK